MKILQMILIIVFLCQCYAMPVSERYNCETKLESGEDPLDDRCGFELLFSAKAYSLYPNEQGAANLYLVAVYDCYRQLELEKKCQEASPYLPVWPPRQ